MPFLELNPDVRHFIHKSKMEFISTSTPNYYGNGKNVPKTYNRELVLNTYWVFNTLKKYWYWIFNTFWEEVLEKVLILSDWRSNTQYFFQEFFSHFNQKIQNFHAKLIFHSNKILEMKTLLQNQYFDSIYF